MMNDKEEFELAKEVSTVREKSFKRVWDTLFKINVNEHTEKKVNLTYLSWAWAYAEMMNNFPSFDYEFLPQENHADGTATVHVRCWIVLDGVTLSRSMWLPVMDYRNKAISNPDSMAVNTAKMRCLTKCISMYGLGAYIYAGEDLPQDDDKAEPTQAGVNATAAVGAAQVKKAAPKTKVTPIKGKAPEQKPVTDDFYCEDEDAAEEYAQFMIKTATEMHGDSMEHLVEFWQLNTNASNYLKDNFPDQYEKVRVAFTDLKQQLIGE